MRRAVLLAVGFLSFGLVGLGAGSAAAQLSAPATNATHYTDPTGDAFGGPDIVNVNVSNNDSGSLHFSVEVPTAEQLPSGAFLGIYIDPDKNNANDYIIWMQSTGSGVNSALYHLVGGTAQIVQDPSLHVTYLRGATVDISRASVGVSTGFQFQVATIRPDQQSSWDTAPDSGWFSYNVIIGQPQPSITSIEVKSVSWTPDPPKAGKALVATAKVVSNTGAPLPSGQVQCDAKVGGVAIKGTGRFVPGAGICTWSLPASAAGKSITGKVTVLYQQLSAWGNLSGKIAGAASLQIRGIRTSPATPHAGQPFYASVGVWRHQPGVPDQRWGTGSVSCRATVSGRPLRVVLNKAIAGYGAQCGWAVPTTARGGTMFVSIGLRSAGLSVTKAYRYRVT
jgi:hypothetical protein